VNKFSAPFITFSLFSNIYYYSEIRLLSLLLLLLLEKAGQLSPPLQAKGWMTEDLGFNSYPVGTGVKATVT
jgi:hypothetical protein